MNRISCLFCTLLETFRISLIKEAYEKDSRDATDKETLARYHFLSLVPTLP